MLALAALKPGNINLSLLVLQKCYSCKQVGRKATRQDRWATALVAYVVVSPVNRQKEGNKDRWRTAVVVC